MNYQTYNFILLFYTFHERYYLRYIPIPFELVDFVNDGGLFFPNSQEASPNGTVPIIGGDITTSTGLRDTVNAIRDYSPIYEMTNGRPDYTDITFKKWLEEISNKPFFCTDATNLFILIARNSGLKAREWNFLGKGWAPGIGHSVVEFFNPRSGTWQLVDAQHGAIFLDANGDITDMVSVLRAIKNESKSDIKIDYQKYEKIWGGSLEKYFFESEQIQQAVLQLRQATWLSTTNKKFGLNGHFVIGYAIYNDKSQHDKRVIITKITAIISLFLFIIAAWFFKEICRKREKR
mgnify:CR=1 FL=1